MLDRFPASLSIAHMVPRIASERGVDHLPLLAAVGLDGRDRGWDRQIVARSRIATLLTLLARKAGDETLGIDLASAADPAALGPAGMALGVGQTVGEALGAHIRHMPTLQGGLDYRLVPDGPRARLVHRYLGGTPEESRVMAEGVAAFVLNAVRVTAGDRTLPMHVEFPHRPRVSPGRYEDRLQAAVAFGAGNAITISFDAAILDRANRAVRPASLVEGPALTSRDSLLDDTALVTTIRRTFAPAALSGRLTLGHVAAALGLAPRSLQRRLASIGLAFEDLVDDWRQDEACRMLSATAMSVRDIGRMLGYSDAAHFIRAFHRWRGVPPAMWRSRQA
jgi:AraC-like DNA-binding protein